MLSLVPVRQIRSPLPLLILFVLLCSQLALLARYNH
jgi:hypothetical protein